MSEYQILFSCRSEECNREESKLFLVLERYLQVLQKTAYAAPGGFMLYFTRLAFRCLPFHNFLQYVDREVIMLTPDFAKLTIRGTV